ncbi:hypothetical protein BU17DRAFT_83588 [Hysterangium stoloniferum]|nr:hypothetical protein BU17DRAFT_83588 [Hysterangium stoloniferum]
MSINNSAYCPELLLHYPETDPFSDAAQERLNNLIQDFLNTGLAFVNGASVEDVRETSQIITRTQTGASDNIAPRDPAEESNVSEDDDDRYPDYQLKKVDKGKGRDEREGPGVSGLWSYVDQSEHPVPLSANGVETINLLSDDDNSDESVHDDVGYEDTDGSFEEYEDQELHDQGRLDDGEDEVQSISSTGTQPPRASDPAEITYIYNSDEEDSMQAVSDLDPARPDNDSKWIHRTARDDDGDGDYDEGSIHDSRSNPEAVDNSYLKGNSLRAIDDEERQLPDMCHRLGKESDDEGGGVIEDEEMYNLPLFGCSSAHDQPVIGEMSSTPYQLPLSQDAMGIVMSEVMTEHPGDVILSDYIIPEAAVNHTPFATKAGSYEPDDIHEGSVSMVDHEDIVSGASTSTDIVVDASTLPDISMPAPGEIMEPAHPPRIIQPTLAKNVTPSSDQSDGMSDVASVISSSTKVSRLLISRSPSPVSHAGSRSPSVGTQMSPVGTTTSIFVPSIRPYVPHNHSHAGMTASLSTPVSKQIQAPTSWKSSPSPSLNVSPSQPTSAHMTRARCTDHKISFPGPDGLLYFLVPRCSLLNPEVEKDAGIVDCGVATTAEVKSAIGDLEAIGLDSSTLRVIRQLTGVMLMREGQVGYLPRSGERIGHRARPKVSRVPLREPSLEPEIEPESSGLSGPSSHISPTNFDSPAPSDSTSRSSVHEGSLYEPSSNSDGEAERQGGGRRLKRKKGQLSSSTDKQSDMDSPSPKKRKK